MVLRLSKEHGVNPSVSVCFLCQEDKNEILMLGRLPNDEEAPHRGCYGYEPCDKCKDWQKQGVILISVKTDDKEYRTGGWVVVKDEFIVRTFDKETSDHAIKSRACFISDQAWDELKLPREEVPA